MPVLPLVPVVLLLFLEPHMSGILLTTAIVGTILMLTGCGGVLTWCGATAAALLLKPAPDAGGIHWISAGPPEHMVR